MPEIKFERYERVSEYNVERRAEGDLRSIINDFRVIIDGEYRAILHRKVWGRGYTLRDIDHRPIERKPGARWSSVEIASKSLFQMAILAALTEGLIPDAQTLEEIRATETAEMHAEAEEEDARRRMGRLGDAAPRMYDLIQRCLSIGTISSEIARADARALIRFIDNGEPLE